MPVAASALYFLNLRGDVLIIRLYRDDVGYCITEGVNLPFRILSTIKELGRTRMEINVKVKSVFGAKMLALGVVVKFPVPKQTAKTSFQVTSGRAKYSAAIDCIVWKIR